MAQILPSLLLVAFLLTIGTYAASTKTGFSLQLINRFPANLSKSELAGRLLQQSQSRISYLKQSILESRTNTTVLRPPVHERGGTYVVSLTIGRGKGLQSYYLEMDTGSGLTWTQCQPCNPCFPQSAPIFNPSRSPSYQLIRGDDPLCNPPYQRQNDGCTYRLSYADGSTITGMVSKETFTFQSSTQQPESFPDLAFGCTHSSSRLVGFRGDPAGILGLAASAESFITQLRDYTHGRFSYCLFPHSVVSSNYLQFGDDIVMNGPVQRTPMLIRNGFYYLSLQDISMGGQRLHLRPGTFELRKDGTGGCIIDSGAGITHMIDEAFNSVEVFLVVYFKHFNLERVKGEDFGYNNFRICYRLERDFDSFPSMTLHFKGADLELAWDRLFFIDVARKVFCFLIEPDNSLMAIGAYQQFDTRFTYDIMHRELLFVPEHCAHSA